MRKLTAAIAALVLAGTAAAAPAYAASEATGQGSSFAGKRITQCAASYSDNKITYTPNSSGTGRKALTAGSVDFAGSDAAYGLKAEETAKVVNVAVTGGPVTFAYNVPGVSNLNVSSALLSDIFTGKVTTWNDPAIKALNKSARLPNTPIVIVYRSKDSGTSQNLTDWLKQTNPSAGWSVNGYFAQANTTKLPATAIGQGDSAGVATTVAKTKGAIGYLDLADSISKALKLANLQNKYKSGSKTITQYVKPTAASAGLFLGAQKMDAKGIVTIDFTKQVKNAYSASLFTYIVGPTANGTAEGDAIRGFVEYVLTGCKATPGYAALPKSFQSQLLKLAAKID